MLFERLASRVLGNDQSLRAHAEVIAANELGQAGLWPYAISGDLPILLVRVLGDDDLPLVRQVLQAQDYWRLKGLRADVVIINEHPVSYLDEVQAQLTALLDSGPWSTWQQRPGGAYLLRADRMGRAERVLIEAVAEVVLRGDRGDLRTQLARPDARQQAIETFVPTASPRGDVATATIDNPSMTFSNGLGGFTDEGKTYAIVLDGAEETPMPWVNVIANPRFGTVVTASGAALTWSDNSRENRLTPFANDPISDPTAEALYIRDDETGESWSPTPGPLPRRATGRYVVRHMAGLTQFSTVAYGIEHELQIFVDADDPVKFSLLTLTNHGPAARPLSVFAYNEWMLGPPREGVQAHVVTEIDQEIRHDLREKRVQPGVRPPPGLFVCERRTVFGDRGSASLYRPQRRSVTARRARPHGPVGRRRRDAGSLCRSAHPVCIEAGRAPATAFPARRRHRSPSRR